MKKVLILILAICLGLSITGATCLKNVQTIACNPPADVVAAAKTALPILEQILGTLVPGTAPFMSVAQQINVVDTITAGMCISTTQLNDLIAYLQGPEVKAALAKKAVKGAAPVLNIQPLIDWRTKLGA